MQEVAWETKTDVQACVAGLKLKYKIALKSRENNESV